MKRFRKVFSYLKYVNLVDLLTFREIIEFHCIMQLNLAGKYKLVMFFKSF